MVLAGKILCSFILNQHTTSVISGADSQQLQLLNRIRLVWGTCFSLAGSKTPGARAWLRYLLLREGGGKVRVEVGTSSLKGRCDLLQ